MRRFGSRCGAICKVVPLIKSKMGRCWRPILPLCQQQLPQLSPQPQLLLPQPQPQLHPQFPELLLQKPPQQHTRMRISTIHRQESPFPLLRHMLLTSL